MTGVAPRRAVRTKSSEQTDEAIGPSIDHDAHPGNGLKMLTLGAIGVVFGDIGTSPLYALRESFHAHAGHAPPVDSESILGIISLVVWSLIIIISIKYLRFVIRADNQGEGGILALTALVRNDSDGRRKATRWLILLGLFGASLLYGDGMITPAVSVLSAVEGTTVVTDNLDRLVVPIAVVILVCLFAIQRRGTASVGRIFGPVMVLWFVVLSVLGVTNLVHDPSILRAVSPTYGLRFLLDDGLTGFLVLGSVFLVVTGGEALYADMGHFGPKPIRVGWYTLVLPALLLNYMGQGAMLLGHPDRIDNPFYRMAPRWALWPLVLLATSATVIASQALISGAFSLTRQAVQLGYLPRVRILQTSESHQGQIYVPVINWVLLFACSALVIGFKTSSNLAAAYGLAVTGTMAITTILFYRVSRDRFGWSRLAAFPLCGVFLAIDLAFLGANIPKVPDGGWFPLTVGLVLLLVLTTWFAGRKITAERIAHRNSTMDAFIASMRSSPVPRGPGVGIYLGSNAEMVPQALASHLRHAGVLPRHVVVLAVKVENVPHMPDGGTLEHEDLGADIHRLTYRVGFSDDIDVPAILAARGSALCGFDLDRGSYVLGRETLRVTDRPGMAKWRERLFVLMVRNATTADVFFKLPPDKTIELGVQVEL